MRIRTLATALAATAVAVGITVAVPSAAHADQCIWIKAPDGTWVMHCTG